MKKCSKCNKNKDLSNSHKDSSRPDGYAYRCKSCYKTVPSQTKGTLEYFKRSSWNNINKRCVNGSCFQENNPKNLCYIENNVKVTMTKKMFYKWCDENKRSIMWYYSRGMTPSVDRVDPNKNYHTSNIQIISLKKNIIKSNRRVR